MKIAVIGGGPAGLYFSLLMKKARPACEVTVVERNRADDTFGWGVVFSNETLGHFREADAESFRQITEAFARWDNIDTYFKGEVIRSGGHGFCGIARRRLLQILQERCVELGVRLEFLRESEALAEFAGYDLVVAADGINSKIRTAHEDVFQPTIEPGKARFIWLGTTRRFEAFTFIIRDSEHGLFQVHAYPFDAETSTFIVETDAETWRRAGLDAASVEDSVAYLEALFAPELQGHRLMTNKSAWICFRTISCKTWWHGNTVLIGDAAHTAHFSIGSGTKLAMEDAIALVAALERHPGEVPAALADYHEGRWLDVAKLQRAARVSQAWFEDISRYKHMAPEQLVLSMMTRSKRVTHGNLRVRDAGYVAGVDRWFAAQAGASAGPPMFAPFRLRELTLHNRVVVSPMCQYSAAEGLINDWHLVHLGGLALGGAGLVMTEMTDVSPTGRITPGCAGLYAPEHAAAWRRVVEFVHTRSAAKIGVQIGHAGRKGATQNQWDRPDLPLASAQAWELLAPSPIAWAPGFATPRAMDEADMARVLADFVRTTELAAEAGFDLLELHMAHGYLLSSFISPLSNKREDEYGGDLAGRMRFPLRVFAAVRAAWPAARPMSVRISATDWIDGGLTGDDAVEVARMLQAAGADLIDVSTGQTSPEGRPVYGRMFQTQFSDQIRNTLGIATIAVGNISDWDQVNTIVASGRADLCALARPHLLDPHFTLRAALEQGYRGPGVVWPPQYLAAR
ncbi:bifunctional salicylyl-CoA 5-hydroxylase/oxidoreductase [Nannocystis sp.]|uniref:bifunctional salicylyl-CoA 5-hydroxylase/oxidoreductase n=1 Tax=Nannocystis sp. TaxID=1962667 RepID=UPI0025E07E68|nr:bifunctional salicylyl-CoA 5-hydroxylase/oxidoreductase [Nannocystis sp.]MBK7826926.1 bifunctional salicylyl-CoA 5-hydroxylase/oxidoreductase [Nannocystis sp.]